MTDDEYTYFSQSYAPSHAEPTPSQQAVENLMSAAAKRRVDRATLSLTGTRCLIENTDESNAVEYAHCLPRATKDRLLDNLEFSWNMPRFTLNVDTRANVIRLSSKFHKLFDLDRWVLLPETSIINIYNNAIKENQKFPIINHPFYKYTVIAHPTMLHVPIHRQTSISTDENQPPIDFAFYPHPYENFPVITSHVHPRFVICNTATKFRSILWPEDIWDVDWIKIQNIWNAWSKEVDRDKPAGKAFYLNPRNDNPDVGDNDSVRTGNHRVLRKRKHPEQQDSPTPAQKSSKQRLTDGPWLDEETLRAFNQQTSTHVEEMKSKKELVLEWLNGVSTTGDKESSSLDVTMAVAGALLEHS